MRLLLSCSELGLGHVSRMRLLGKRLRKRGHELWFFSGGLPYALLKKEFKNVHYSTPIAWYGSTHGVMVSASVLNILIPLLRFDYERREFKIKKSSSDEVIHRYYDLRRHLRIIKPDVIVSDGDVLALRLATRWKIPSVFITNVIRPSLYFPVFLVPGERLTEMYIRKSTRIIVPDVPKHTICEYNLGDLDSIGIKDKVDFVGSFFDVKFEEGREKLIFAPISGPLGTRAKIAREVVPVLSKLDEKSLVSLGEPGSKFVKEVGNCKVYGWLQDLQRKESMRNARIVIFSGGHGTSFEVLKYRKPSVCMPTQPEQKANARKLTELKCSVFVENGKQLVSAIEKIENERKSFRKNVSKLSEYCSRFNGLDAAVSVVENIL